MLKKKFAAAFLCAVLLILAVGISVSADNGAVVLNYADFTSGNGICGVQNAKASDGVNYGQSALTRKTGTDGGKYAVFHPTLTGNNPAHGFIQVKYSDVYLGAEDDVEYFILEFDFATETQYLDKLEFEFIGKDTSDKSVFGSEKPYVSTASSGKFTINSAGNVIELEQERGVWQHLTFVAKIARNDASGVGSVNSVLYTYCNGNFVGSGKLFIKNAVYMHSLRISQIRGSQVNSTDTFCFDNLKVTKLTTAYTGNLSSILADNTKSLKEFDLATYKDGYVFPKTAAIAKIGDKQYSNVSELEADMKPGDAITVLANIKDKINIVCECSIYNPNGYSFTYDAGAFEKVESQNTISFLAPFDSVEVLWHIGDKTEKQTYTDRVVPTPPAYAPTVDVNGVPWKAVGFSKSEGGEVVSDLGVVSPYNKEFWLVYEKPVAYSANNSGTKTYAYNLNETEALISGAQSGDTVYLLADLSTAASFTVSSKTLTVDLGGHTLHMAEGGTGDMFTVGAGGNLTVKNGNIEAYKNGRIPVGSTSIVRRRIFTTSSDSSTLTASGLKIDACKMIAIIKNGNATFDKCEIDFTKDYDNMIDLYSNNNNDAPTTLNFKDCTVKAYKTIVNVYKPSGVSNNNAVINATNCTMKTSERVFATEAAGAVSINGGKYDCQYLFGKLNTNTDATAFISEGTLLNFSVLDEKGALKLNLDGGAVARINDDSGYKYTVAKSYAKINWVWPDKSKGENWRVGDMPICPFVLPESTREVKYEMPKIVPVSAAATYTLKTAQNFETKVSAELGANYSLNFYISEINFTSVKVGNTTYKMSEAKVVEVNGKTYYKFNTGSIDAINSANTIAVTVSVQSAFGERQYRYDINLLKYLDQVLSGGYGYDTYRLALSVLGCINAQLPDNYTNKTYNDIAKKYNTDTVTSDISDNGADISAVANAVSGATVVCEGGIAYRIKLNSAFSGEIKATYTIGGKECVDAFNIVGGKYGTKSFIEIRTDAAAFADGVKISVGAATGKIDMALCKSQTEGASQDQLAAIYAYSKEVKRYVDTSKEG